MFAFQTMHSMNSLTGTLGVDCSKVLFMLLPFSTKQNSFAGPCSHLLDKLQPAISRSLTYTYCAVTLWRSPSACSINPAGITHAQKATFAVWLMEGHFLYTLGYLYFAWLSSFFPSFILTISVVRKNSHRVKTEQNVKFYHTCLSSCAYFGVAKLSRTLDF